MKSRTLATLALCCLAAAACNEMKPEKPSPETVDKAAATSGVVQPGHLGHEEQEAKSTLTEEQKKLVIAKIGEVTLTLGDFEERLNEQPTYARIRYNSLEKKKEFLDNLVEFELLALEAKSKGYDKDPDVVFAMKQQMIKKLMKEDLSDLVKLSDVTEKEMRAFYEQNADLYHKPEQVRASGIVLIDKAKADQVLAELNKAIADNPRRKRQTFNDFVRDKSADDASAKRNGDLGFFTATGDAEEPATDLPAGVAAAAFGLERINDTSPVIEADGKYWILMLTNRRPKVDKTFEEVKRQIQNKLFRDEKEGARERYLADLRKKANVTTHEENLALVKNPDVHDQMMPGLDLPQGGGPGVDKPEGMQKQLEQMRKKAEEKAHDHEH